MCLGICFFIAFSCYSGNYKRVWSDEKRKKKKCDVKHC